MKRVFKIAQKFDRVCMEYLGQGECDWGVCGKLTEFEISRPPFRETDGNWYRLAQIRLVFDHVQTYWAYGIEEFAKDFVGFRGVGFEGQYVFLRVIPNN